MQAAYRIGALRLINWHNFVDETLDVTGSLFLIGDNGSGKTTLLDAIHCALTGDWKVELNAAARIAGRRAEGRDLAGIVLRYHVEKGFQRPSGAIAYSALELVRTGGDGRLPARVTMGIGLYVPGPGARAEKWGFLVPKPLAEVPLVAEGSERRPLDRRALASALGPGAVLDIGRYRTAVGERLFGSRDHLAEVASFLSAGKAYRELVTRTQNFSELFAGLLREPEVETYQEARRSLDAIERLRADRDALDTELHSLRSLIDAREKVADERATIGRYDFLIAHHAAEAARELLQEHRERSQAARSAEEQARLEHADAGQKVANLDAERDRLRSSRGARQLEQARELEGLLDKAQAAAQERDQEHAALLARVAGEEESLQGEVASLASLASEGRTTVAEVSSAVARALASEALETCAQLERRFALLAGRPDAEGFEGSAAQAELRAIARALAARGQSLREEARAAEHAQEAARAEAEAAEAEAQELRARGSLAPPLAELDAARRMLEEAGIAARAVYECLEPKRGLSPEELGWIEAALGPRLLCALLVPAKEHAKARDLVLARFPGIPVVERRAPVAASADWMGESAGEARVLDFLKIEGGDAAMTALLEHHLGALAWYREEDGRGASFLDRRGHMRAGRLEERLPPGVARWVGGKARERALRAALAALEQRAREAQRAAQEEAQKAREAGERAQLLENGRERLEGLELAAVERLVFLRDERQRGLRSLGAEELRLAGELRAARGRAQELEQSLAVVRRALQEEGLDALAERLRELEDGLLRERERLARAGNAAAVAEERLRVAHEQLSAAQDSLEECESELSIARGRLHAVAPAEALQDLEDWVFRTKRGTQIKKENLAGNREEAVRREVRWIAQIEGSDGVRHPSLWQKYAFEYRRAENAILDSAGRDVDRDASDLQRQLDEVDTALDEKSQDLLERVVLEELAGALRRDVLELRGTIREVNALVADLQFGRHRYRIDAKLRPDYRRLLGLLDQSSALSPGARGELKSFFETRLGDLRGMGEDGLPPFLDYRRWYEFRMQVSTLDAEGVELTRDRRAQGSGGEQAVPNYLLLFCLTTLLYQGVDAKVRPLLLDEAFYGIDAGRRDELLRFCERAGITLVVATPEMDGVTDALAASTTLLVEKTAEDDVYLWDARFKRQEAQLFADEGASAPEELSLGAGASSAEGAGGERE